MVTKLHLEYQRANQMLQEESEVFVEGKFGQRGFSKVEFLRLHDLAKVDDYACIWHLASKIVTKWRDWKRARIGSCAFLNARHLIF
jgi:hypothetical protein